MPRSATEQQRRPERPARPAIRIQSGSAAAGPGWTREPQERGDFLHRIRVFPPEIRDWRESLVDSLLGGRRAAPADRDPMRALVDEGVSRLREIDRLIAPSGSRLALSRVDGGDVHAKRVFRRLEPWRELAGTPAARTSLPPRLDGLWSMLSTHGRTLCLARAPACGTCELRKLCGTYRRTCVAQQSESPAPTVIDLFAGAGGLSEGFRRAGFHIVAAADLDEVATKTYRFNHPEMPDDAAMVGDIRELGAATLRRHLGGRRLDVLSGAPPCQGFSSAGMRSKSTRLSYRAQSDERNYLFESLVDLALQLKPKLFLMENVPGMESARNEDLSFMETAAERLRAGGYRTATWRLTASSFGVPQERLRSFLVASASSLPLPMPPREEYQNSRRGDFDSDALPPITLEEAISDLPPREADSGTAADLWPQASDTTGFRYRRYVGKFKLASTSAFVFNHFVRYHNPRDLELYALLQPGEDSVHAIEKHKRPDLMRYRRDVFDDKYARLRPDRPCKTIVAHLAKDGNGYIHPSQVRSLSIREAARVQSFPDDFVFTGSPSDQWVMLGNAVPPVLGEAIARSFRQVLSRGTT